MNYEKQVMFIGSGTGFTLSTAYAIMTVAINNCINEKGGEDMEALEEMNNVEIMKNAMDKSKNIQEYMVSAREENAAKTYAMLKKQ